jgi:hypothetical protein
MNFDSSVLMAIYFPLGIILLGLGGYMYDKINNKHYYDNKYKNDTLDSHRMMFNLFYSAPFKFIYLSIKNKNVKDIIVGMLFIVILIGAIITGIIMIKK